MIKVELEKELKIKKLELTIRKAETAKEELDYKMLEKKVEVERMKEHRDLQDEAIKKAKDELKELKNDVSINKTVNTQTSN